MAGRVQRRLAEEAGIEGGGIEGGGFERGGIERHRE